MYFSLFLPNTFDSKRQASSCISGEARVFISVYASASHHTRQRPLTCRRPESLKFLPHYWRPKGTGVCVKAREKTENEDIIIIIKRYIIWCVLVQLVISFYFSSFIIIIHLFIFIFFSSLITFTRWGFVSLDRLLLLSTKEYFITERKNFFAFNSFTYSISWYHL